ncbi:hypothetical protein ABFV47_33075 [Mycolicibacterium fortuitum]|uniref:hypothetical protein n=1 Tax=Mycolicibacterium TaxID=1866885 RepID=UPI0032046918
MKAISIFDVTEDMLPVRAPYRPVTDDDRLYLQLLALDPPSPPHRPPEDRVAGNHRDSYGISDAEHNVRRLCSRCGIHFSLCPHAGFGICVDCADVELCLTA